MEETRLPERDEVCDQNQSSRESWPKSSVRQELDGKMKLCTSEGCLWQEVVQEPF